MMDWGNSFNRLVAHLFICCILFFGQILYAANSALTLSTQSAVPDHLLIKFKPGTSDAVKAEISQQLGAITSTKLLTTPTAKFSANSIAGKALSSLTSWEKVEFTPGSDLTQLMALLSQNPAIEFVQPDYILRTSQTPNDPQFNQLWGMLNINGPLVWNITTGSKNIVVAVVDSGVNYNHSDLAANMWINPSPTQNDIYGRDFFNNDSDPMDDHGHGTHVAGTIGAVGNNNIGVVGVNWNVSIMALKSMGAKGEGFTSNAVAAIGYAVANGAKIINASWGNAVCPNAPNPRLPDAALQDAINLANTNGVLFVAAAGNEGGDNDNGFILNNSKDPQCNGQLSFNYPSSFTFTNIIAVASIDDISLPNNYNIISSFSNFGQTSVDLGAPGRGILSTWNNGAYFTANGTSMAAPHVTGAAALLWSAAPNLTHLEIKGLLLNNTVPNIDLAGRTVSGGQLNVWNSLQQLDTTPPAAINSLAADTVTPTSISLTWTAVGDDGTTGQVSAYDLRFSTVAINANNFNFANPATGVTATNPPGSPESFTVNNLIANTVYNFAIVAIDGAGNQGTISNIVSASTDITNQAPTAVPGGPYQGNPNTPVVFDGSASSDPEASPLTYSWDFGDGTTGTGVAPSHTYTAVGSYTVTLTVNDTLIDSLPVTTSVDIVNRPPISDPGGPYTGFVNQPINFDGSGSSDPDGDSLTYSWNFNDRSAVVNGITAVHTYILPGTYQVTLVVSDGPAFAITHHDVTISDAAQAPVANIGGPYSGGVTQPIQFDGSGSSDPNNDPLTYAWTFGNGSTGTGVNPTHAYAQAGNYNVTLMVSDGTNQSPTASTQVVIAIPVAHPGGPYVGTIGSPVVFDGSTSTGTSGQALNYLWDFGDGSTGSGPIPSHIYTLAGAYNIQLIVSDGFEPSLPVTTTATITAQSNNAPVISQITATPSTILDTESSALSVVASDPENSTLTYSWSVTGGLGTFDNPAIATPVFTPIDVVGNQAVAITVVVSDGVNMVSDSIQISVNDANPPANNLPPVIGLVSATPSSILDSETSALSVIATDPENAPLTYSWSISNNSGSFDDAAIASPVYTPMNIVGNQMITVSVIVSDGVNSVSGFVQITVTDANPPANNLPPVITQVTANAQTIQDTGESSLNVIATDPENATLSYNWRVGGNNNGSFNDATIASPIYTPTDIVGSQMVMIMVDVSDGVHTVTGSVQITVNDANPPATNLPPIISLTTAIPQSITDMESSSLAVTASDPENVQLTYSWSVMPAIDPSLVFDNPNISSPMFTPGDINGNKTVTLKVDVSDGVNTVSDTIDIMINDASPPPALRLFTENFQFADLSAWTLVDASPIQGRDVIQAPSQWSAYSGSLVQSSNIYSTPVSSLLPEKLGTYSSYNNGMAWSDYRLKLKIHSSDNDAIGVMFRYQDDKNYYRFSWDMARQYRRLVKNNAGKFTVLAEDKIPYTVDQEYMVEIVAKGAFIQILINNQLIFSVNDIDLGQVISQGSIGLYSWSNAGSTFDDITVDDISSVNLPPIINSITADKTNILDTETSQLTVNAFDPDSQTGLAYTWIVSQGAGSFNDNTSPQPIYTPAAAIGSQHITLTVEVSDGTATSSHSILLTVSDANISGSLLKENFSTNTITGWAKQDEPGAFSGPSNWEVSGGQLLQNSNIYSLPANPEDLAKLGSYVSYIAGATWQDYRVTLLMSSMDNDSLGVMFRIQDDNNYYRISWDQERSYRRLVKRQGNRFISLHADTVTYQRDTVYTFDITVTNNATNTATTIVINTHYIDMNGNQQNLPPISIIDNNNPIQQGTIGLYNWLNSDSRFDDILVDDLTAALP